MAASPSRWSRICPPWARRPRCWKRTSASSSASISRTRGLSEFAAGNRAKLIRFDKQLGRQREYALRLTDLLKRGDSKANVLLQPGDVIIIPESTF